MTECKSIQLIVSSYPILMRIQRNSACSSSRNNSLIVVRWSILQINNPQPNMKSSLLVLNPCSWVVNVHVVLTTQLNAYGKKLTAKCPTATTGDVPLKPPIKSQLATKFNIVRDIPWNNTRNYTVIHVLTNRHQGLLNPAFWFKVLCLFKYVVELGRLLAWAFIVNTNVPFD